MRPLTRRGVCAALGAFALRTAIAASARVTPWPSGKPANALRLTAIDGAVWDLQSLRGKAVVLHVWASWCEPCRAEMPQLNNLAKSHSELQILAINHGEGQASIQRFLSSTPVDYPILRDPQGSVLRTWGHGVLPLSILISRDGRPRFTIDGEFDWDGPEAARLLRPLLG
ncbi:MAG TPA: TlpA disulfide reductase family protein [Steroidobacteraceae bacterium]|nr:TlpA disulfide reductase family protein [Steroidobacteraceae bacterium]